MMIFLLIDHVCDSDACCDFDAVCDFDADESDADEILLQKEVLSSERGEKLAGLESLRQQVQS